MQHAEKSVVVHGHKNKRAFFKKKFKKLCTHKKRSASTCPAYLLHSIRLHDFITKIGRFPSRIIEYKVMVELMLTTLSKAPVGA